VTGAMVKRSETRKDGKDRLHKANVAMSIRARDGGTADEYEMPSMKRLRRGDVVLVGIESASANTPVCRRFPYTTA